ncbi:MAG: DUF2520 domain-containing protein [Agathobacter sp.]|nr:DUF2520 domain-containing protein [Agathobacter sp.]
MKIGFIGAGKVGTSLGMLFVEGSIQVTGYYSRHKESAKEAADFTGSRVYTDISQLVEDSDGIFVTVTDGEINKVYNQLVEIGIEGKLICHCSGAMTAEEAFCGIKEHGAFGYSIHPLFPVSSKFTSYQEMADAFFCIEGDAEYLSKWQEIFADLGLKTRVIDTKNKVMYHEACAIASNLVCGLLQESLELMDECGFSQEDALKALKPLVMSNIKNCLEKGPMNSLTGPVDRGDDKTVQKHLDVLHTEEEKQMYKSVSVKLVEMAKRRHPETDYKNIEQILKSGGC